LAVKVENSNPGKLFRSLSEFKKVRLKLLAADVSWILKRRKANKKTITAKIINHALFEIIGL